MPGIATRGGALGISRTDVDARVGAPEHHARALARVIREGYLGARHRLAAALAVHRARGLAVGDEPHERSADDGEAATDASRRAVPRVGARSFARRGRESLAGGDDAAQRPRFRRAGHRPADDGDGRASGGRARFL